MEDNNNEENNEIIDNQITTISKQRFFKEPLLAKVKISNKSLDLIDKKIKELYTK